MMTSKSMIYPVYYTLALRCLSTGVILIFLAHLVAPESTCHFPQFMQNQHPGGSTGERYKWTTKKWWLYLRHNGKWLEKQDVYIQNGDLRRERIRSHKCSRSTQTGWKSNLELEDKNCLRKTLVHTQQCLNHEGNNTFRVLQYSTDGSHVFTCIKFIQRSKGIVQIYNGKPSNTNKSDLCDGLEYEVWPWIAEPSERDTTPCPLSGGFSFRTIRRLTNEDFCEDEWRRSTLEVECVRGDGMTFTAPMGSKCNPFVKNTEVQKLHCRAGWEEGDFIYIIASDKHGPKYCLKFPKNQEGEFSVFLYFSVVCPNKKDGKPHLGIQYYELIMRRKDPYDCEDEDPEKCRKQLPSLDMCATDKRIAPHCPKTCQQCQTTIRNTLKGRRCIFKHRIHGNWMLYDASGTNNVSINKQAVSFPGLPFFYCLREEIIIMDENYKDKTFRFKSYSEFDNGCAVRFTCLEFYRKINNVLRYRISPSVREEKDFNKQCKFHNDPFPYNDMYRSRLTKNLIQSKDLLWPAYCGLKGVMPFNGTINNRRCHGTVDDWDQKTCMTRSSLVFRAENCPGLVLNLEFQCVGYLENNSKDKKLILTRTKNGSNIFNCWVITDDGVSSTSMYQLPDAQCDFNMALPSKHDRRPAIYVNLDSRNKHRNCTPENYGEPDFTQTEVTKSTRMTYNISGQPISSQTEVIIERERPKVETHHTDPPFQGLHSGATTATTMATSRSPSAWGLLLVLVVALYNNIIIAR